jgi:hypothetical protein
VPVSPNTWLAGGGNTVAGATNFMSTTGNVVNITGVVVLPGIEAPSAERSPMIMRPYDQELVTCQRYFRPLDFNGPMLATNTTDISFNSTYLMRAPPTVTAVNTLGVYSNGSNRVQSAPNCVFATTSVPTIGLFTCSNFTGLVAGGTAVRSGDLSYVIAKLDARL